MAPRGGITDLTRLLDGMPDPIYVVDDRRRLVFVNRACAAWLGHAPQELLGRECRYRSDETQDPIAAAANALCPPPTAFAGRRSMTEIVLPPTPEQAPDVIVTRVVEFTPIGLGSAGSAVVLAWLPPADVVLEQEEIERRTADEAQRLHALVARLRQAGAARYALGRLAGVSPAMLRVRRQLAAAASADFSVAIVGPRGSGRGHAARTLHYLRAAAAGPGGDAKSSVPLVPLDAGVLGAELLQSTLRGLVRQARDNASGAPTLLLNDADLLPDDAQRELAGFMRLVELPIRIITTSSRPLVQLAGESRFRRDLAEWLSTLVIEIPPLASRPEDVPPLAQLLLEESGARGDKQLGGFAPEVIDLLVQHGWPGEARELAAVVDECCATADGPLIGVRDLPHRILLTAEARRVVPKRDEPIVLDEFLARVEKELITRALERSKGNKTKAAKLLGLTRPRLYRRMVQLGLEAGPVIFEETPRDGEPPESS